MKRASDECPGRLYDDLTALARRIRTLVGDVTTVVWADHTGAIHAGDAAKAEHLPSHWLVGIYNGAQTTSDIEDDLREVLRQRTPRAIIG